MSQFYLPKDSTVLRFNFKDYFSVRICNHKRKKLDLTKSRLKPKPL